MKTPDLLRKTAACAAILALAAHDLGAVPIAQIMQRSSRGTPAALPHMGLPPVKNVAGLAAPL